MQKDEMEILRAVSVDLGDGLMLVLSYQYHTEADETKANPFGKTPKDRGKSRYRMVGRVSSKEDVEKAVKTLLTDAYRTNPWKWPDDRDWDGRILYMKDSTNACASNWLRLKLKKIVPYETGMRILDGYKKNVEAVSKAKKTRKGVKGTEPEFYDVFTKAAVTEKKGYLCTDGSTVDLDDLEALKSKKGQTLVKEIRMKLVGTDPVKAKPESKPEQNAAGTVSDASKTEAA